jgi:PAS domain S-box-containing protein
MPAMNKSIFKTTLLYAGLAGAFILFDLVLDFLIGDEPGYSLYHIILAIAVVFISFIFLNLTLANRRRAEAALRLARDELEIRVQERTKELNCLFSISNLAGKPNLALEEILQEIVELLPPAWLYSDAAYARIILDNQEFRTKNYQDTTWKQTGAIVVHGIQAGLVEVGYLEERPAQDKGPFYVEERKLLDEIAERLGRLTERKRAEEALRESEERYRTQFDNFPEPATIWDRNGVLMMQNLISARNLGGQREDYFGKSIYDIFGESARGYMERMVRVIDSGIAESQEDLVELSSGKRYFWTSMQQITNPNGQSGVQIISYDITDRKRAEEDLRTSEEKFATVFHFSPEAIAIISQTDLNILDINEAFTKILGHGRSEVIGKNWGVLGFAFSSDKLDEISALYQKDGKLTDYELAFNTKTGEIAAVLISVTSITIQGEACLLIIAHDITGRKRSEEALRQAQSELEAGIQQRIALEERQRLARELHDSVSQALYGISLGVHTALALFDTERTKVLEALNYVLSQAQVGLTEMRALIFELRPESLELEGLVSALTKQTAALRARYGLEVEVSLCDEPDLPFSVKEALYRVTQEALQNAVKHAQASRLEVSLACEAEYIRLDVCDNGMGFDPQAVYPGHLGLRSMHERALNLGGTLEINSSSMNGTHICARFPLLSS